VFILISPQAREGGLQVKENVTIEKAGARTKNGDSGELDRF